MTFVVTLIQAIIKKKGMLFKNRSEGKYSPNESRQNSEAFGHGEGSVKGAINKEMFHVKQSHMSVESCYPSIETSNENKHNDYNRALWFNQRLMPEYP